MSKTTDTGKLKVETPGDREIRVTRTFDAPRKLVFDAHTRPELVQKWMSGYAGWTMPVCEIDLKVGGRLRYEWAPIDPAAGQGFGLEGGYKEIDAPGRLVHWEAFTGPFKGEPMDVITEFVEANGKTTMTMRMLFPSAEAARQAADTGMTDGMEYSYQRLEDDILAKA
jgi:uncharacterized protein YndB with AHSA1/START domain